MARDDLHELAGAYVLDALDAEPARSFETHLRSCPRCQEEVASLRDTAASLAFGLDAPGVPAGLGDRILQAARAERGEARRPRRTWAVPAAAVAVAAAILLAFWATSLSRSLDRERSANQFNGRIIPILSDPDARRIPISGANGSLVVSPTRSAVLIVDGLNEAPRGSTYQAWVVTEKGAEPAGLFRAGPGRKFARLTRPVPEGAKFAVTLERDGGSDKPTGPLLIRAQVPF
jgi:anti-sigma-K factor RskA